MNWLLLPLHCDPCQSPSWKLMEKNLLVDLWDLKGGNETQSRAGLGLRWGPDQGLGLETGGLVYTEESSQCTARLWLAGSRHSPGWACLPAGSQCHKPLCGLLLPASSHHLPIPHCPMHTPPTGPLAWGQVWRGVGSFLLCPHSQFRAIFHSRLWGHTI